jgi:hypothetical protein
VLLQPAEAHHQKGSVPTEREALTNSVRTELNSVDLSSKILARKKTATPHKVVHSKGRNFQSTGTENEVDTRLLEELDI